MNYFDIAVDALATDARIGHLFWQASPGDRSILYNLLDREGGIGMTLPGSANDQLWSCLAEHGWMEAMETLKDMPMPMSQFVLTETGRRVLPVVWDQLMRAAEKA